MSCSNCYNGCTEIVSDRCVKYTGPDIALLGIKKGDSLSYVEQALIGFLTSAMDGSGIIPVIDSQIICELVSTNLPDCKDISLNDVLSALIKSVCSLQTQLVAVSETVNTINGPFEVECLTETDGESGIHNVLQDVITFLCNLNTSFSELVASLPSTYVLQTNLNNQIANYLSGIGYGTSVRDKMAPYTAVEYYGPLSNFDASGAGLDLTGSGGLDWTKVYLCNGDNGTPDKRGRVGVGATTMGGSVPMDAAVLPGGNNPNYTVTSPSVSTKQGENAVTLDVTQLPAHSHSASATASQEAHQHFTVAQGATDVALDGNTPIKEDSAFSADYTLRGTEGSATKAVTNETTPAITVDEVIVGDTGGGLPHNNIQPSLACYYIIYLP